MRWMMTTAAAALRLALAPMSASAQQASPPGADVAALPGGLSMRALATMDRVSDPRVSPDGRRVLYSVRSTDWDGNRGVSALWVADVSGGEPRKLAVSTGGASTGRWAVDGQAIYFLSARGGSNQVWRADAQGNAAVQITTYPVDVVAFKVSPDGRNLILSLPIYIDCDTLQCTRDRIEADNRSPSTVSGYDRMPLRQFDHWNDGRRQHLFVQPLNGSGLAEGQPRDLMAGIDADTPSQPQGTEDEFAISPDGRTVVYSTQTQGAGEAFTNNSDLYTVSIDGAVTRNITLDNVGADGSPVFSPDGRRLAWLAGRRENVGGDQAVVMVADADGSNPRVLVDDWDRGPANLRWRSSGRALLTTTADNGVQRLYEINARSGEVEALSGSGSITMMDEANGVLVVGDEDFSLPPDLYVYSPGDAPWRTITSQNAATMAALDLPNAQRFEFAGWNDEPVQGWVFRPVGYVEGRTYPAVYLIHGGPKSPWTESWSYRWNPQIYTSAGYAVVMVNFHGSPGYGQAFTEAINDHWGDRPLEDLQKGWAAALSANSFIDGDRACALGASYGGYMVNLIAGKWNGPWACLVNHAGVFDVPQLMNAMDIGNFIWEFGGPSWERMDLYRRFSPGDFAGDWEKPMLVLHGERDFRVPIDQGLATFSALQRQNIPSRFVRIPDENHWVLKPRNYVDWQREILDWTARWTTEAP